MTAASQPTDKLRLLLRASLPLTLLALVLALLLASLAQLTAPRISANVQHHAQRQLAELLQVPVAQLAAQPVPTSYPLRVCVGAEQRLVSQHRAKGYAGDIQYLLASSNGRILGIAILQHQETPGLGDRIEPAKSNWLQQFLALPAPTTADDWRLRRDAGPVDGISGATITARALTASIAGALLAVPATTHDCDLQLPALPP